MFQGVMTDYKFLNFSCDPVKKPRLSIMNVCVTLINITQKLAVFCVIVKYPKQFTMLRTSCVRFNSHSAGRNSTVSTSQRQAKKIVPIVRRQFSKLVLTMVKTQSLIIEHYWVAKKVVNLFVDYCYLL